MVSSLKAPSRASQIRPENSFSSSESLTSKSQRQNDIALYEAKNLGDCLWPQTSEGQYARAFLSPLIQRGVANYIENVQTDLRVLIVGDTVLPITINEAEYENSYVCSPYSYFISYARDSLDVLSQAWLCNLMDRLLGGLGRALQQFHCNKVVVVNNWLYSTNLYPQLEPHQLKQIVQFLQHAFPNHAIVFRCIDPYTNPTCYYTLQQMSCEYIATRQIFFIRPDKSSLSETRLFKSDVKLLNKCEYEIIGNDQLTEEDIPRLLKLYRDLYIEKYSQLNPKFNESFLQLMLKHHLLNFRALKKDGRIDGIVGYVERNGTMYCPFFGYDGDVPKEKSLYRLLSTVLMLEAYERRLLFHQSSGASMFKTIRKAQACIEYTAVFYNHLKLQRHLPWIMLKNLYNSVGMIYMKRY